VDERHCYLEHTGLAQNLRRPKWREHKYVKDFEKAAQATKDHYMVFDVVGMAMYANTAEKHIVERYALSEPLLARITYVAKPDWRVGHFFREVPTGYLESLRSGT